MSEPGGGPVAGGRGAGEDANAIRLVRITGWDGWHRNLVCASGWWLEGWGAVPLKWLFHGSPVREERLVLVSIAQVDKEKRGRRSRGAKRKENAYLLILGISGNYGLPPHNETTRSLFLAFPSHVHPPHGPATTYLPEQRKTLLSLPPAVLR